VKLHPYLNYGGNCEQAFRFYEQHLGGKFTRMMTQGEQPAPNAVPPDHPRTFEAQQFLRRTACKW
jgi:PhnB protein